MPTRTGPFTTKPQAARALLRSAARKPVRYVALGYAGYIGLGFVLLALPIAHHQPGVPLVDHLFLAASAVSTTGLATVDPGATYTRFGEVVLLLLVQFGGLGFMSVSTAVWRLLSLDQPMGEQVARTVFSVPRGTDGERFVTRVVLYSLAVEAVGTVLLAWRFAALGHDDALWLGVFHSVSAFCTAGLALFPDGLERFASDAPLLGIVGFLSFLGGIGFLVANNLADRARRRCEHLSVSARLVLIGLPGIIAVASLLYLLFEPRLHAMPPGQAMLNAWFQATSTVTSAGFNAMPQAGLAPPSVVVTYLLMVVGASPSGTGGGLKITTVALVLASVLATLRGRLDVRVLGSRVTLLRVRQANASFVLLGVLVGLAMFALSLTERLPFDRLLFETISALCTVGLSLGATPELSPAGKLVVVALMYIGRVGLLGFGVALAAELASEREATRTGPDPLEDVAV